jgi:hypothetical protein
LKKAMTPEEIMPLPHDQKEKGPSSPDEREKKLAQAQEIFKKILTN